MEAKVDCIFKGDKTCCRCRHDLPRYRPMIPLVPIVEAPAAVGSKPTTENK